MTEFSVPTIWCFFFSASQVTCSSVLHSLVAESEMAVVESRSRIVVELILQMIWWGWGIFSRKAKGKKLVQHCVTLDSAAFFKVHYKLNRTAVKTVRRERDTVAENRKVINLRGKPGRAHKSRHEEAALETSSQQQWFSWLSISLFSVSPRSNSFTSLTLPLQPSISAGIQSEQRRQKWWADR